MSLDDFEDRLESLKQKKQREAEERRMLASLSPEKKRELFIDEMIETLHQDLGLTNDQLKVVRLRLRTAEDQHAVLIEKLQRLTELTEEMVGYLKPVPQTEEEKKMRLLMRIEMLNLMEWARKK